MRKTFAKMTIANTTIAKTPALAHHLAKGLGAFKAGIVLAAALISAQNFANAADLPKNTVEVLKKLQFDPSILVGLDKELAVPAEWIEQARKAPLLKISGSDEVPLHAVLVKSFLERYPFIKIDYQRGSANERVVRPLLAFAEGRYLVDVVRSMDGSLSEFTKLNAAETLRDLPTYESTLPGAHYENGYGVAFRARPYCMSYNTTLLKKSDLPKTWRELPDTAILANGRIGAVMLPHLWVMPLWGKYGETWGVKYIDEFFTKLKPQIRTEGLNAAMSLVGAGENYVSLPAYPERIKELQDKGAPIAWHCPDMVPLEMSKLAIFRGSPGMFAGKIYANWLLSKEGQLSQLSVFGTTPVHKDLQRKEFYIYPDEMAGKPLESFDDQAMTDRFIALWNGYATGKGK